ncbi:MAG: NADH-quinone oxidoreductase subunit C [Chitinophagaceae bacterium]|nr:NADH-quinone oxidoreductase subunit C [Chitinophagaceae bacterium]MBK8310078.1 NADH-quinone oxidoreductase subunit C [Chitinophagaceae bacterium]MBP6476538.1 NADH-quinone oxidoreductase subunit C [Chitinophagaceae bacterium]MBP7107441.1 NADH-quinone oxidoreductase subunit C [Chitinophagaceae bacterium]MBP7315247.1 NADH-quinone oxidoreductase subunit C [Chitinophagaceae bacterium]
MTNEELKIKLAEILPTATIEEAAEIGPGWITVNVEPIEWLAFAQQLRKEEALHFNFLFCLTCIDWKTHLTMVYHLRSTIFHHNIVVKAKLDRDKPAIETVSHIWRTAEFHEREVYEMFGVDFLNHPDLRLLILPDGWEGKNPMRKDFEDPVNMIRL